MDENYISKLLDLIISDSDISEWSTREILSFLIGYCSKDFPLFADLLSEIRSKDMR